MADTGWKAAGTLANNAALGTTAWSIGGSSGSITSFSNDLSQYLLASNFNAGVPTGATVDGFEVRFNRSGAVGTVATFAARINYNGSFTGDNKSTGDSWETSSTQKLYGGASDKWGVTSPTVSNVNNSNFGFGVVAEWLVDGGLGFAELSAGDFELKVYYTAGVSNTGNFFAFF